MIVSGLLLYETHTALSTHSFLENQCLQAVGCGQCQAVMARRQCVQSGHPKYTHRYPVLSQAAPSYPPTCTGSSHSPHPALEGRGRTQSPTQEHSLDLRLHLRAIWWQFTVLQAPRFSSLGCHTQKWQSDPSSLALYTHTHTHTTFSS